MAFIDLKPGSPNVPTAAEAKDMRQTLRAHPDWDVSNQAAGTLNLTADESLAKFLWLDASSGNITINLPAVAGDNKIIRWKRTDSSTTNTTTFDPNGAEQIEGGSTFAPPAGSSGEIRSEGSAWYVTAFSVETPVEFVS